MTASQLLLRPLTEDDIPTIFSLTSDPEVARFMRFSTHKSIQEAEDLYQEYTSPGNYGYMICLKDDLTPRRGCRSEKRGKRGVHPFHVCLSLSPFLEPGLQHGSNPAFKRSCCPGRNKMPKSLCGPG